MLVGAWGIVVRFGSSPVISAAGQKLQLCLQKLLANGDYLGAAIVKEEMREHAFLHADGAKGDQRSALTFEFNTAEDESQADELWRDRREREPKRLKVEPQQFRMTCAVCASQGW